MLMRCKDTTISPYYLSIFLNSRIGQNILDREKTFSAQPTVSMERIRTIAIPILSSTFQTQISDLVNQSHVLRQQSTQEYQEAEDMLFEELNLVVISYLRLFQKDPIECLLLMYQ